MPKQSIKEEEFLKLDNTEKCDTIIKVILGEIEYIKSDRRENTNDGDAKGDRR